MRLIIRSSIIFGDRPIIHSSTVSIIMISWCFTTLLHNTPAVYTIFMIVFPSSLQHTEQPYIHVVVVSVILVEIMFDFLYAAAISFDHIHACMANPWCALLQCTIRGHCTVCAPYQRPRVLPDSGDATAERSLPGILHRRGVRVRQQWQVSRLLGGGHFQYPFSMFMPLVCSEIVWFTWQLSRLVYSATHSFQFSQHPYCVV